MAEISKKSLISDRIGTAAPLAASGIKARPDKRQLSAKWLVGTFLTGITSSLLMGVALVAALTTGEAVETPLQADATISDDALRQNGIKGNRLISTFSLPQAKDRQRMELSTVVRSNERSIVSTTPFMLAKMDLSASRPKQRNYPKFDPLKVFKRPTSTLKAAEGSIYGAALDNNVAIASIPFDRGSRRFDNSNLPSTKDIEAFVRNQAVLLDEGVTQPVALSYINPERFAGFDTTDYSVGMNIRIVPENVSVATRAHNETGDTLAEHFNEVFVPVSEEASILETFINGGIKEEDADAMAKALGIVLKNDTLDSGMILRASLLQSEEGAEIVRATIYDGDEHILSVSLDDKNQYVPAAAPEIPPTLDLANATTKKKAVATGKTGSIYDAIYRSSFAYGATDAMAEQLIKLFASELDYRRAVRKTDQMELFFSHPDENGRATEESAMLYVKAKFGNREHTFYSFRMADGTVDFFSPEGRSGRPFLLRNPVPTGKFRSGFGMRRHPVTRVYKRHTGVDWSAPRGTPILASGDGVVEKAGWAGGYGKQTKIRHANGYISSYSHQSRFGRGIKPGVRVRQGQVVGYVGTTGLSTGNHLHYELIVNGNKVDPMRVRLPVGRVLKGEELARFQDERARIDALLNNGTVDERLASLTK